MKEEQYERAKAEQSFDYRLSRMRMIIYAGADADNHTLIELLDKLLDQHQQMAALLTPEQRTQVGLSPHPFFGCCNG